MTEKLFYADAYLKTFTARVLTCVPENDLWCVTLDRTAFYPEGGGQPADTGTLGDAQVVDVSEKNGEIFHKISVPIAPDTTLTGEINWTARFSRMQQHTGEHIVSGLIHQLYGFDNVGFHMGHDAVTIDLSGTILPDQLRYVERLANEAVWKNLAIEIDYPDAAALSVLDYRSKKELTGAVRIVTVPAYDVCACCGTHLKTTGEIGMIKLVTAQNYKGGMRISLLCGDRALEDYAAQNEQTHALAAFLSVKPFETANAVHRLSAENEAQKQRCAALKKECFRYRAQEVLENATYAVVFEEELSPAELRTFCLILMERCGVAAVFAGDGQTAWKYAVGSRLTDVRPLGKKLNAAFSGRGGGCAELVQGTLTGEREEIDAFFGGLVTI